MLQKAVGAFLFRRSIHANTVRSRLRSAQLKARRPHKGTILTMEHRRARLRWARHHFRFTRRQWGSVLFTDESRIQLSRADGRRRVWRRRNEHFTDTCVLKYNRWGGGSVHFWGGITQFAKTRLVIFDRNVNANTYVNNVIQPVVIPFLNRQFRRGGGTLQQDGAPAHTALLTRNVLARNNVDILDFPALSPDMAPIEHVWDELKRRVYARPNPPSTIPELRNAVVHEWENIPQQFIANIITSMRRRCQALMRSRGGYTRY